MQKNLLYLALSVSLSAGRNVVSKKTAVTSGNRAQFFLSQTVLFAFAAAVLAVIGIKDLVNVSFLTVFYGVIYGVLLILSQWMLTLALKGCNTSVCSVVYSLGFLLPTVSGVIFWNETFTVLNIFGVLAAVGVIVLTSNGRGKEQNGKTNFVAFIFIAMVASGGLGIMQKVQQMSKVADQKGAFLLIGFVFAFLCSFAAFLICKGRLNTTKIKIISPAITGICFGGANLCNTILAGRMKSAVFFPVQNVTTILLTTVLSILLFKEKLTLKTIIILLLGVTVILLFSV